MLHNRYDSRTSYYGYNSRCCDYRWYLLSEIRWFNYCKLVVNKDSTATTTSAGTMADDTWTTLGYYYSTKDRKFYIYKDNNLVGTSVNTNAPDDEEIALSFTIQNGEAVAKTMSIDYLVAGKERTAATEL